MKSKLGATLFALVFAIPFGGVGALATWGIANTFAESGRAQEWVVVQARVDEAELRTSRGSKGGVSYQAAGKYTYSFGGNPYTGTRLGFDALGGYDNIGDWQASMASFLEEAKKAGKTIPVFVNPDNPSEAVVDRNVRWGMVLFMGVFAVLFGGVGVGALIALVVIWKGKPAKGGKETAGETRVARVRPAGSSAASDAWKGSLALWVFAILWNVIAIPISILVVHDVLEDGEYVALLVLIFPALGLLLLWSAVASTIGLFRRGKATIALQPDVPQAGSAFSGAVSFPRGAKSGEAFKVRLICNRTVETEKRLNTAPSWSKEVSANVQAGAQGARVAFRFEIPADVPRAEPSTEERKVSHAWRIEVAPARASGITSYGFDIEVRPAPADAFPHGPELGTFGAPLAGALAAAAPAGAMAAMPDTTLAKLLGSDQAGKLTAEQRASFAALPRDAQEMAGQVVRNLPQIKKIVGIIVAVFIVMQILGVIITIFASS